MNSFNRLLEIYPEAYTEEERIQTFLWYHLRRYSRKNTVHIKTIQNYFRKADRKISSRNLIQQALNDPKRFPAGTKPDTYGMACDQNWHNENFGSCFDQQNFRERFLRQSEMLRAEHPWGYWLGIIGSIASIIGIPLAIVLQAIQ